MDIIFTASQVNYSPFDIHGQITANQSCQTANTHAGVTSPKHNKAVNHNDIMKCSKFKLVAKIICESFC